MSDTNFMVWNIPESTAEAAEDRKKYDEAKVRDVLTELKVEGLAIKNVVRSGLKGGRFPRKIKVILQTKEDCNKVLEKSVSADLSNDVKISRDQTYNQRQEARLFRLEKEREEQEGVTPAATTQGGRGRGRGRGRGPGRPRGSGRGRGGGRGGGADRSESRKRQKSDDESERAEEEDENKRRRTTTPATQTAPGEASVSTTSSFAATVQTPPPPLRSVTERPGTPHPTPRLAAREAEDQPSF